MSYESLTRFPVLEHILLCGKANMVMLKGHCGNRDLEIATEFAQLRTLRINGNITSNAISKYIYQGSSTLEVLFLDNVNIDDNGLTGIERFKSLS